MYTVNGKSVVIVKHSSYDSAGTPDAELVRFLRGKAARVIDILHPFPDSTTIPLNTTVNEYSDDGGHVKCTVAPLFRGPSVLFYIKDFILTLYYVLKSGSVHDLMICADNLNAFAGLVLKLLGRTRRVVYYVIDFTPVRFENRLLDRIYHTLNKFCSYHADAIWNVSARMVEGRESVGIRKDRSAQQITVPLGCAFGDFTRKDAGEVNASDIVYFGSLRGEHGPGLILEALPFLVEKHPETRVVFAGDGPLRAVLEARAEELGVSANVRFTGYLETGAEIYNELCSAGLALATYPPDDGSYKLYSDPGKIKMYLAAGLPILVTDVPPIARELAEKGAGVIVEHSGKSLAAAILGLLDDPKDYVSMRENAVRFGAEFDWDRIWERTFASMTFQREQS